MSHWWLLLCGCDDDRGSYLNQFKSEKYKNLSFFSFHFHLTNIFLWRLFDCLWKNACKNYWWFFAGQTISIKQQPTLELLFFWTTQKKPTINLPFTFQLSFNWPVQLNGFHSCCCYRSILMRNIFKLKRKVFRLKSPRSFFILSLSLKSQSYIQIHWIRENDRWRRRRRHHHRKNSPFTNTPTQRKNDVET